MCVFCVSSLKENPTLSARRRDIVLEFLHRNIAFLQASLADQQREIESLRHQLQQQQPQSYSIHPTTSSSHNMGPDVTRALSHLNDELREKAMQIQSVQMDVERNVAKQKALEVRQCVCVCVSTCMCFNQY